MSPDRTEISHQEASTDGTPPNPTVGGTRLPRNPLERAYRALWRRLGYVWGPRLMSAIRMRWVVLRHPHAEVRFGKGVHLAPGFSLHMPDGGSFVVGDYVEFRHGFRAEVGPTARVAIGPGCMLGYNAVIQCSTRIEIGTRCMFGQSTMIVDGNHRFRDPTKPMLAQGYDYRPIRINDDATVMTKCTIIADIGERSVIGANSVVSSSIPPYCVAVGAPAQIVDYFGPEKQRPAELDGKVPADGAGASERAED